MWPKIHVDAAGRILPVEKQVWLEQNWKPGAREWYHHASQGGQFPPMINVPYEWFIALEQPMLSIGAAGSAGRPALSRSLRLHSVDHRRAAPSTGGAAREPDESNGYEERQGICWRGGIGCRSASPAPTAHNDPMLLPDGKPWRHPATGETMSALGLTCAACHTGRFTYGNTEFLVDGGSATDRHRQAEHRDWLVAGLHQVRLAPVQSIRAPAAGSDANNEAARAALRAQLDAVLKRVGMLNKLDGKANRRRRRRKDTGGSTR